MPVYPQECVRIRPGYHHGVLGNIGGWEGVVLRSFSVDGVEYYDLELSAATLDNISKEKQQEYFWKKVVFTRLRIERHLTSSQSSNEAHERRAAAIAGIQQSWFLTVGQKENDPTKVASDGASPSKNTINRRKFVGLATGVSLFSLLVIMSQCDECDCGTGGGRGGSWHRMGGGYSS